MSKSKGNVVSPEQLRQRYGADTVRLFMMFAAPPEQSLEWSDSGVDGSHRFIKRLWHLCHQVAAKPENLGISHIDISKHYAADWQQFHQILLRIDHDMQALHFNTVVSGAMKCFNLLHDWSDQRMQAYGLHQLLRILSPFTPHICESLWHTLGHNGACEMQSWPKADQKVLAHDHAIEWVIQINGKVRGRLQHAKQATQTEIEQAALNHTNINQQLIDGYTRVIFVPGRLINFIIPTS